MNAAMNYPIKKLIIVASLFPMFSKAQDSTLQKLYQLRDNFVNEIKKAGFTPSLKPPEIIIDTPASYATLGNFDDSTNMLHTTGAWKTVPKSFQGLFTFTAFQMKNGETGESF